MTNKKFACVWDAIEETPEEAANMRLRTSLMVSLREFIKTNNLTQAEAAKMFGVTQPRISDLMRGKINVFGIESLVNMVVASGHQIEMTISKAA